LIMRKGHCLLKDAAISGDRNVIKTKWENIVKCKGHTIESAHLWNVKPNVVFTLFYRPRRPIGRIEV
jgi:hypothetical protein